MRNELMWIIRAMPTCSIVRDVKKRISRMNRTTGMELIPWVQIVGILDQVRAYIKIGLGYVTISVRLGAP